MSESKSDTTKPARPATRSRARKVDAPPVEQPVAPPPVAQGNGHGALGILLTDDEAVQLADDFARGQVCHFEIFSTVRLPLV